MFFGIDARQYSVVRRHRGDGEGIQPGYMAKSTWAAGPRVAGVWISLGVEVKPSSAIPEERYERNNSMEDFLMGAIAMASAVAGLFFLRFWRDTGDRLFVIFSVAFFLLGITRIGLALSRTPVEDLTHWYWVRLAAFILIVIAIVDKNRR
jgi:Family of unknown function (DUF5985)